MPGRPFVEHAEKVDVTSTRNMMLSPGGGEPAPRSEADPGAIEAVLGSGMVFGGDLDMPVIDWRHYLEDELDMHNSHQSFASRARMLRHDGNASNQIIWFTDVDHPEERFDQTPMAFEVIDEWMMNVLEHPERGVAGNKPDRALDSCFDAEGHLIYSGEDAWAGLLDNKSKGACTQRFPTYSTARIVAGAPITGDVFKCNLQSVEEAISTGVYGSWNPTSEQQARLEEIFSTGVCAYSEREQHSGY